MNLIAFRRHIKTVDHATLDAYFDQISADAKRARSPARKLGYALALDALVIESRLRKTAPSADASAMTDDESLAELAA